MENPPKIFKIGNHSVRKILNAWELFICCFSNSSPHLVSLVVLMSFTGKLFFLFQSEFCKLCVSMALLQMGCSHKHYIMSLNHSKYKKILKLKLGKKEESKTPTHLHHLHSNKLSHEACIGSYCLQGISTFNTAFNQKVSLKRLFHMNPHISKHFKANLWSHPSAL